MQLWHLTWSARGRNPLFPTEALRCAALRVIGLRAGPFLALFCVVDDHVHVVLVCSRARAGTIARAIAKGLIPLAATGLKPVHIEPIERRAHAEWQLSYSLGQVEKHDLPDHPALWSGSCLRDLVGARRIGDDPLRIQDMLPRFRPGKAYQKVGLPFSGPAPLDDRHLGEVPAASIAAAAATAVAADPALAGHHAPTVRARRIAVSLGRAGGHPDSRLADALGVTGRAIRRLAERPPDPRDLDAARLGLAIDGLLDARTLGRYWAERDRKRAG